MIKLTQAILIAKPGNFRNDVYKTGRSFSLTLWAQKSEALSAAAVRQSNRAITRDLGISLADFAKLTNRATPFRHTDLALRVGRKLPPSERRIPLRVWTPEPEKVEAYLDDSPVSADDWAASVGRGDVVTVLVRPLARVYRIRRFPVPWTALAGLSEIA